jgi:hypothetical protein
MDNVTLESLKQQIEDYRKELAEELSAQSCGNDYDRILRLSQELDELIVKYSRITETHK